MQPQAFAAKVQILFPHLLHYATTSQVASSSETVLTEDQVTSLPSPQKMDPSFPERPPTPLQASLGEGRDAFQRPQLGQRVLDDRAPAVAAI